MTVPIDAEALRGHPLVSTLEWHQELGSTNDRAKQLVASGVALPTLVYAERQTAGRGRGANRWWSADGALTFSLIVDTRTYEIAPEQQGIVSLATAVAILEAVNTVTGLAARYKWPNDVFLDGKKLAGVLIESPRPGQLVIGVGINANNRFHTAPDEVRDRAVSLADRAGQPIDTEALLLAFLDSMAACLPLIAMKPSELVDAARSACLLTGRTLTIADGDRKATGICRGLDEVGSIRLEAEGRITAFVAGTIEAADPPLASAPQPPTPQAST